MTRLLLIMSNPNVNKECVRVPVICWNEKAVRIVMQGDDVAPLLFDLPDETARRLLLVAGGDGDGFVMMNPDRFAETSPAAFIAYMPGYGQSAWQRVPASIQREVEEKIKPLMVCL